MKHILHSKRGMTLIEIMVSTALLSMVGMALTATLIGSVRGWGLGATREYTTGNVTLAMQRLTSEIRDGSAASHTVLNASDQNDTLLTVKFPKIVTDAGTNEKFYDTSTASITTVKYYVSNGNLVKNNGSHISVIGRGITYATFGGSDGRVTITLKSDETLGDRTATKTLNGHVGLRNYRD